MRKYICTGIFIWRFFLVYIYDKLNRSINGISLGLSEVFKYGKLDGLLNVISLGQEDGISLWYSVRDSFGYSEGFTYWNLIVTLVGKYLVEEDILYHVSVS